MSIANGVDVVFDVVVVKLAVLDVDGFEVPCSAPPECVTPIATITPMMITAHAIITKPFLHIYGGKVLLLQTSF